MSRWKAEFDQHPFQEIWSDLKSILIDVNVDDQTISTSVEELARLNKVVGFIDSILQCLDADLTPQTIWPNFQAQATNCRSEINSYISNRNIAHIVQANLHADNLLSYVKPFLVLPVEAAKSAIRAVEDYSNAVGNFLSRFESTSASIVTSLDDMHIKSTESLRKINENQEKIAGTAIELLGESEDSESVKKSIFDLRNSAEKQTIAIDAMHRKLLTGVDGSDSVKDQVSAALINVNSSSSDATILLNKIAGQTDDLNAFHVTVFGTRDGETGKVSGGLKNEMLLRTGKLEEYETQQAKTHQHLKEKIEGLLPGATSAGLASAYGSLASRFKKSVQFYTGLFSACVVLLVACSVAIATKSFTLYPTFEVIWVEEREWHFIFKALLLKAPFVAPIVWLALFATKRRSQYERLNQEYAHKEAFATSYASYKLQLQELKIDSDNLQKELISKAIETMAFNASSTLDGKHDEKLPAHQIVEDALRNDKNTKTHSPNSLV
jgi:hypothetical protein